MNQWKYYLKSDFESSITAGNPDEKSQNMSISKTCGY